ncbi:MAG: hypothetical protein VKM17_11545 [Cyanobacteriota bacterium]|nr:hypothetical protein [Cyanobacteriota bacterium]
MACRRCGCRMLTKVGHARPMLICTDCGQPVDQRESIAMARQRLWGALTLVGLAMMSGSMLLLATMYEWRRPGSMEGVFGTREEEAGNEEKREESRALFEPSGLVQPQASEPPGGVEQPGSKERISGLDTSGASGRPEPSPTVSTQPATTAAQQEHQQPNADRQEQ